jgi:hypothetical protein
MYTQDLTLLSSHALHSAEQDSSGNGLACWTIVSGDQFILYDDAYQAVPEVQSSGSGFMTFPDASLQGSMLNAQRTRTIAIQIVFAAKYCPGHFLLHGKSVAMFRADGETHLPKPERDVSPCSWRIEQRTKPVVTFREGVRTVVGRFQESLRVKSVRVRKFGFVVVLRMFSFEPH